MLDKVYIHPNTPIIVVCQGIFTFMYTCDDNAMLRQVSLHGYQNFNKYTTFSSC